MRRSFLRVLFNGLRQDWEERQNKVKQEVLKFIVQTQNKEIKFGKQQISKVFDEWYTVPSYQRHYVWDSDNINDMLNDFQENYISHGAEEYFLGSYIIQSKIGDNDLLDGQQRITTLFLLFAFLRDYEKSSSEVKSTCEELIVQKANSIKKIKEHIRLTYEIRGNVKKFIEDNIKDLGSITAGWENIIAKANDKKESLSIQRMCNALICFRAFFDEQNIDINSYLSFILNNVVMIYISADSLEDAFRLFSVMNDRGQKLSNADILKSSNLEKVPDQDKNDVAREWENIQEDLGDDFDRFLAFVRTLLLKKRQRASLLDEYEKMIFAPGLIQKGKPFFDLLTKTYKTYNKLINLVGNTDIPYCNLIRMLQHCMSSTDWIAVVLAYANKFQTNRLTEFAQKVAHKNIADSVCGIGPTRRIDNLNNIILLIEKANSIDEVFDNDTVYSFDQNVFLANIQSDVYGRNYTEALLMLLEYKYKDKSEWKDFGIVSIEHILPQTPKDNSQWAQDFMEEERITWTHKIGNLCLIGRRKNSSLSNLDYTDKLAKYFQGNIGTFAHTQFIYNTYPKAWTPKELEDNHNRVINDLKQIFGILSA